MVARVYEPGFRVDLHHKDLGILTAAAREAGVAIPLGALTAQLMGDCAPRATETSTIARCTCSWRPCPAADPRDLLASPTAHACWLHSRRWSALRSVYSGMMRLSRSSG